MSKVPLKLCPFCGSIATYCHVKMIGNPYYLKFRVQCIECGAITSTYDTPEECAKSWNKRFEPPTPYGAMTPALNDRLKRRKKR